MNKYQEALDYIVANSCPSGVSCSECNINNICNNLVKDKINVLQELIDKQDKYKWHDLRKDPNDLPTHNSIVMFAHYCVGEKIGYSFVKFDENYIVSKGELAWKYIEEFEDA